MKQINARVRKWGNSLGIVLPKEIIQNQNIKEGTGLNISITIQDKMTVSDFMNFIKSLKLQKSKKSTAQIMKELDRELWNEKW